MGFYLEPTTENQRAVYEQAVQDAAQRAQLIADASGATLGNLLVLQEGPGPCLGTPSSQTGYAQSAAFDRDRKSTRLNSSHVAISYAVFCLKKKINEIHINVSQ